jgi:prostaglandin-endoperoxide synthase 2
MLPSLPKPVQNTLITLLGRSGLGGNDWIREQLSRRIINGFGYDTTLRPRPLSLLADYTSWRSLTDRTYSGRHLPPATDEAMQALPDAKDVLSLFRRDEFTPSTDTSVMFMFFAQWFTDSFLRTDRSDWRKNDSNHDIDLCQIYGTKFAQTEMLRAKVGGRLRSQQIGGEEYPEFLFEPREPGSDAPLVPRPHFDGLHDLHFLADVLLRDATDAHKATFFAVGLEHGNSTIGNTVMNVAFLREHNRIAGILAAEHPSWDDERIFQTTRNILIVLTIKLVVEEYIVHIAPFEFPLKMVSLIADGERWNRQNWCAVEFNLLYRWHMLVPETIGDGAGALDARGFRNNNPLVLEQGIEALTALCSAEPAGRIGLLNTPSFLVDIRDPNWPSAEWRSISLMRNARLRSYNDYREAYGLHRLDDFDDLTSDPVVRERLEGLYDDIDQVEWYVGIFAEDYPDYMMMGGLLTTMVANDAFTQALSNPLLARHIYDDDATFTATGRAIIDSTGSVDDIVKRNATDPSRVHVSFRCNGPVEGGSV